MTIVRVGTTKKYSEGWEAAFARKGAAKSAAKLKTAAASSKKSKRKLARRTVKK